MSIPDNSYWDKIFNRLLEVKDLESFEEAANFLEINASTLRSRKARGSIPYEHFVSKLDARELGYVMKGKRLDNAEHVHSKREPLKSKTQMELYLTELIERVEQAPFSNTTKLRIIDSLIRISRMDFRDTNKA